MPTIICPLPDSSAWLSWTSKESSAICDKGKWALGGDEADLLLNLLGQSRRLLLSQATAISWVPSRSSGGSTRVKSFSFSVVWRGRGLRLIAAEI